MLGSRVKQRVIPASGNHHHGKSSFVFAVSSIAICHVSFWPNAGQASYNRFCQPTYTLAVVAKPVVRCCKVN